MKTNIFLLVLLCLSLPVAATDWLFYRGPAFNGSTPERIANPRISEASIAWRKDLGTGASSVTVKGNRAYSMGNIRGEDIIYCLDAATGQEVWSTRYACKFEERMFEGGTASTPTLDDQHVYTMSYDGQIHCLRQSDGEVVWKKHAQRDFGGKLSSWKYAGSPLVVGSGLLLDIGGRGNSTLALRKASGDKIWGSGDDSAGYASVVPFKHGATVGFLTFKGKALLGVEGRSGRELFRIPWKTSYDVNASTPMVIGDTFFLSSGYNVGRGALYRFSGGDPKPVWRNDDLKTKMSTCAYHDGHLYGVTEKGGQTMCLDVSDGSVKWSERVGGQFGNVVVAGGTLVILGDNGELVLADADPSGWKELARLRVLRERCWVQPTVANGNIYCRSNKGSLACIKLP